MRRKNLIFWGRKQFFFSLSLSFFDSKVHSREPLAPNHTKNFGHFYYLPKKVVMDICHNIWFFRVKISDNLFCTQKSKLSKIVFVNNSSSPSAVSVGLTLKKSRAQKNFLRLLWGCYKSDVLLKWGSVKFDIRKVLCTFSFGCFQIYQNKSAKKYSRIFYRNNSSDKMYA